MKHSKFLSKYNPKLGEKSTKQNEILFQKYADSNAKHKIGDIIRDKYNRIKITEIRYCFSNAPKGNLIFVMYHGIKVKKSGKKIKPKSTANVHESYVK